MTWMLTAGGRKITVDAIEPQDIAIEDLAAHLAKICRFTGACRILWSVAEHSLLVADILAERYPGDHELQLCGLLHDAPEAYLQDLATPVKAGLDRYNAMERAAWWAVAERFGLPLSQPPAVKMADLIALATERRDLMPPHAESWSVLDGIAPMVTRYLGKHERHWRESQQLFLNRFHELNGARAQAAARSVT
jgi:5'-deoxynucleotidase YfbR-like HD superfamily hydrolase